MVVKQCKYINFNIFICACVLEFHCFPIYFSLFNEKKLSIELFSIKKKAANVLGEGHNSYFSCLEKGGTEEKSLGSLC